MEPTSAESGDAVDAGFIRSLEGIGWGDDVDRAPHLDHDSEAPTELRPGTERAD